jgi:putative hemolysin
MSDLNFYVNLGLLLFFVILYAFFNCSETAYISLERYRLQNMLSNHVNGAGKISRLLDKPERLLSTVLMGQNLASAAAVSLGTVLAISLWGDERGALFATLIMTFILLVFGEATPKTFAVRNRERVALVMVNPVRFVTWLFAPAVAVLSWVTNLITRLLGGKSEPTPLVRPEDIEGMIAMGRKEGTVEKSEAKLLTNVLDFGDRPVKDVLVPRPEVISVPRGTKLSEFLAIYAQNPMSRFPVYEDSMDNVIGILSIKDVLMGLARGSINQESPVDELIRPAYFAPETKRIGEIFHEMRDKNYRMAVIIDEYGGTAGVVSLSGLMEEIVGPVGDELSAAEKEYEHINEYTFQVDGGMRIEEANDEMGLGLPEGDYATVAGFILHLLGHFPKQGQQNRYQNLKIVVTKMKGMKIEEVLIAKEKTPRNEQAKGSL